MSTSLAGVMSEAQWVPNTRNGGGTYDPDGFGYPWRIVLHTIEGSANASVIAGHQYPPHLWYDPPSRALYQTVPFSRSGFALYQAPDAPHYTNRARAIQVELSGRAAEAGNWPLPWLDAITEDVVVPICQWVASQGGSINLNHAPPPGAIPGSATEDAPQRMSPDGWARFDGVCSHRHVPMGDSHWDTGGLDTPRIAAHAALTVGGQLAETGDDMTLDEYVRGVGGGYVVDVVSGPDGVWRSITAGNPPPPGSTLQLRSVPALTAWTVESVTASRVIESRLARIEAALAKIPGSSGAGASAQSIVDELVRRLAS
jgi:hypothetical protein